jgi:hypothetical protein
MASEVPGEFTRLSPRFEHDKKAEGVRASNFLVTLNTNVRFEDQDDQLETLSETLYEMADYVFSTGDKLAEITEFGIKGTAKGGKAQFVKGFTNASFEPPWIVSFRVQAGVEVGHNSRGKRLHMHVSVKILHKAFIRLNKDRILEKANQFLEARGFKYPIRNIHIRVTPPSAEDYLLK